MPIAQQGFNITSSSQLGTGVVTSDAIADGTVVSADIADNSIVDADIGAHTTTKITVPFSLVTGTVPILQGGTGQTTAQTALNAIIGTSTQGDILYYNGTNWVKLGFGTAGQFLKTNGSGANPAWAAIAAKACIARVNYGTLATFNNGATNYMSFFDDTITSATDVWGFTCPFAGTIKNLYLRSGEGTNNGTNTITIHKNGVDTGITVAITAAGVTYSDLTNSATVAAGDYITIHSVQGGGAAGQEPRSISLEYDAN